MVSCHSLDERRAEVSPRGRHVTLIRPPAVSSRYSYTIGVVLPIGPAYVAATLREAGHRVAVIDALGEAPLQRGPTAQPTLIYHGLDVAEIVARIDPDTDVIGISVMFSQQWPHVDTIVGAIHARLPHVPIVVGGEHVAGTWEFVLSSCPGVTACVIGEGEETMVDLVDAVAAGRPLDTVAGIACRVDGQPQRTAARERIRDVDDIPRPAWDLFPVAKYLDGGFTYGVNLGRAMPILATRGCPYQCTFCSSPAMWTTRYYVRDVHAVVDEIEEYVARYAVSGVDFYDLTAIIKRDWILAFCAELERRRLRITYQLPTGTRSEALDAEVLAALYRTGCRNICYAPESGSLETLRRIKKKVKLDRMIDSIRAAAREGIVVKANLMIGFPDETRSELWETVRFGVKLAWYGAEDLPLFTYIPYPASELYDRLRRDGVLPPMSNEYFAQMGYADLDGARSLSPHVSSRQLAAVRVLGMALFLVVGYLRHPRRILRTLRALVTERSESVVELRLVDLKRRLLSAMGGRPAPAAPGVGAGTAPSGSGGHRVTCVLPAFNEAGSLPAVVAEWCAALERCTRAYEVIVVDDGSTDETAAVLRDLVARHPRLRVISHGRNLGYGVAIVNGFTQASFPLLFFTDSDGQYDPADFPALLARIDGADVVAGYRVRRADPSGRHTLSRGYNFAARHLIGVGLRDVNCAFKLMHQSVFGRLRITATGFMVNAELAMHARRAGLAIAEVPIHHRPRQAGRSTVRPAHVVSSLYGLIRLRLQRRRPLPGVTPRTIDAITTSSRSLRLDDVASAPPPAG